MLEVAHHIRQSLPDCQFILPLAPSIHPEFLPKMPFVNLIEGSTYEAMKASDLMLIASGTATLEAACLGTPMIVVYKMSRLSWWIVKSLATIDLSGLPNIVAGREIVPELLQNDAKPSQITPIARKLLQSLEARKSQQEELRKVYAQLGNPGTAERTAQIILDCLH
jgi:lipid-A-disaccharide synthase